MAFTEIDEKLLVRAYQAGDERAFDTIVRTQYNALFAHALRRLSQHEAAEDAVQDTLLRAYRALPNLDGDLALRAWLHRILTNVCHDEGNRRRRQQGLVEKVGALPEELADDPGEEAVLHDTVRAMTEALKDLPESYREALVLRYVDGLSFREVAEVTGITEENARARVHRGRLALHKVLSRVAVMAAFIIPGLRRTQTTAPAPGTEQVATSGLSEQAVHLSAQLTSHAMTAAPTVSRLADVAATFPSGTKSALAAAAVTAVAAVSVPVVANQVQERRSPRPPAAVAAPAPTKTPSSGAPIVVGTKELAPSTSTSVAPSTSTSSSLPPSQQSPFVEEPTDTVAEPRPGTVGASRPGTSTTTTTSTTLPPEAPPTKILGELDADSLTLTGATPQWDVQGDARLTASEKSATGALLGRLFVYADGASEGRLTVEVDGRALELRFRGTVVETTTVDGVTTHRIAGSYVFKGVAERGVPERGDVALVFQRGAGTGALAFEFLGPADS